MALRIHLLGNFDLETDGDPLVAIDSVRLQSVLAYLLLHSRARQSRQHVAFQLWPDSSEEQARRNLRKALHQLRHALPDVDRFLHVDARTVQWRADAPYTLDVDQFENALHRAAGLTDNPATQATMLAEAVACYRGDLLPSCYDEWIIPERERLRQAFIKALESLVWLAEDQRDYAAAIHHANHLLRYDPLHEGAYHQLMRLQALNGDHAGALRVYHTCVTVLQRELGVEPGHEVQTAYARLLEMEVPVSLSGRSAFPSPVREQLVGRQPEWQRLRNAWQTTTRDQPHFCLISGEAGIGKTRLAEELLAWCERQGIATARTRSYAAAGGLAYTPVIEWLRSEALQAALSTLDDIWLTEIARLLPELLVERLDLPRPEPLADRWQRQRLFEALARAFLAAPSGPPRPKLLLIDDLQWCDADTLEWLRYLLHLAGREGERGRPLTPLLIVGTARAEEIDHDHPLNALLLDLRGAGQVTEIALGPLAAAECAELAAQVSNTPLDEATTRQLYAQTEGNPLFIVETVRAGVGEWRMEAGDSSHSPQSPLSSLQSLPRKVQAVIQSRLAQLSPPARALASLAAAIGCSFTFGLLQAASEDEESEVVRNLDELWQRGIVRTQGGQAYDFSHDRIREVAYAAISPVQRPVLHRRVARALEQVYAGDLDAVSAQLAAHYEQADNPTQAVAYYRRAAEMAERRFDHANAIVLLDAGLLLLSAQPQQPSFVRLEVEMLLAKADNVDVIKGFTVPEMAEICLQVEELLPYIDDVLRVQVYLRLSTFCSSAGRMVQAEQYANQMLALVGQLKDSAFQYGAYKTAGVVCMQLGRFSLARTYIEKSEVLWRNASTTGVGMIFIYERLLGIWRTLAFTLWLLGYPDQAQAKMADVVALVKQLDNPFELSIVLFFKTLIYRYLRVVESVAIAGQAMIALDSKHGMPLTRAGGLVVQGWVWAQQGKLEEGADQMRAGIDQMIAMNHTMYQTHRLAWLAEAQMQAGQWEDAAATLDEGFAMSDQSGQRSADAELHRLRGEWLAHHQRLAEAEASFDQAIEIARTQEAKSFELRAVMSLCRLWQRQGKRTEAHARLAAVYGWFTEGFDTADLLEAKALLAELA